MGYCIHKRLRMEPPKDSIILSKTHPPMYLIHKYWARKPYNVVSSYIQKYTKLGDTVLDPFCGSGVTIAESILAHRNAIGIDLNPFSTFLSQTTILPVNISQLEEYFQLVHKHASAHIKDLYGVKCPLCSNSAIITKLIWKNIEENTQKQPIEKIQEIRIRCETCGIKNHTVDPEKFSEFYERENDRTEQINSHFDKLLIKYDISVPNIPFHYKSGDKFKQIRHFLIKNPEANHIFTKRNLLVLGLLFSSINKVIPAETKITELSNIRNLLLITFTANIGQSSKMVWVISKRKSSPQKRKEVGSWTHHFFWNPSEFFEINPLLSYATRAAKSIRAQKNLQERMQKKKVKSIQTFSNWSQFSLSHERHKICLINTSSHSIPLPDRSIDYIFTDPPYGDSIQYFELSTLWNRWLGFSTDNQEENEIVINSRQQKSKDTYFQNLEAVFSECYRVLKKNAYMTITFHNTDMIIRNGLIRSVQKCGFFLDSLLFQMPPRNSLKSYLHYKKTPVGDYFLRFTKNPSRVSANHSNSDLKQLVQTTIENVLIHRAEPTNLTFLYNCIDEQLALYNCFPLGDPSLVEETIQTMIKSNQIIINKRHLVSFPNTSKYTEENISLRERIIKYLEEIQDISKMSYSDIYNIVYQKYYGWNTPDRKLLSELIDKIKKN